MKLLIMRSSPDSCLFYVQIFSPAPCSQTSWILRSSLIVRDQVSHTHTHTHTHTKRHVKLLFCVFQFLSIRDLVFAFCRSFIGMFVFVTPGVRGVYPSLVFLCFRFS
jgi:hypothetical protein